MASFEVCGYVNKSGDHFTSGPESTDGVTVFEPPFTLGECFSEIVLGRDGYGMSVAHIGSTDQATVLKINATAYRGEEIERRSAIDEVGKRVVQFIENTHIAAELMQQNPFPEPQEGRDW